MAIPPLVLKIIADSSGVKKGVAGVQKEVGGLKSFMQKNGAAIYTALATGVVAGVAASVKAASDLGESMNAAKQTFEGSIGTIDKFAATSATSFGIAKAEAYEAATAFGAMFDSAGLVTDEAARMSTKMVGLAGDLGSFRNVDPTEMLDRLRSGLAGEAEPLRKFGIFISEARVEAEALGMGMQMVNGKFTDAQKIQARYNIILEDSKKAQGDFGRTLGTSLPNQIRVLRAQMVNLAASVGKVLIPVLVKAAKAVNEIIGPLITAIEKTEEFVAAHPPVEKAAGHFADTLKNNLAPGLSLVESLFGDNAKVAKDEFGPAVTGVSDEIHRMIREFRGVDPVANSFRTELAKGGITANRFTNMTAEKFREWAKGAAGNFDAVGAALDVLAGKAKVTADKVIHAFERQAKNIRDYRSNLETVQQRNIPDALLQQLVDMGQEGAGILAELAGASDRKFNQMVRAMQRAQRQNNQLLADLRRLRDEAAAAIIVNVRFQQQGLPNMQQRAGGGPVRAGTPYIVGERGPEIFVPSASGSIVANGSSSGGAGKIDIILDRQRFVRQSEYETTYRGF